MLPPSEARTEGTRRPRRAVVLAPAWAEKGGTSGALSELCGRYPARVTDTAGWTAVAVAAVAVVVSICVAWLTKRMADAAETSAATALMATEAANRSAESSQRSADAAVAGVSVEFDLIAVAVSAGHHDRVLTCRVQNKGATVWVHGFQLAFAHPLRPDMYRRLQDRPIFPPSEQVPVLLHRDEYTLFRTENVVVQGSQVDYLYGSILYSLDGTSEPTRRLVRYENPDFQA